MAVFTQNFKKTIPWAALFLTLAGVIVFQWLGMLGGVRARTVDVVGECHGRVEKDTAAITLRIQALAPTSAESMAAARHAYNIAAAMLEQINGLEKQTSRWESYEKNEWDNINNTQVSLGIQTIISLDVSSKNADDIEHVLKLAEQIENIYPENLRMLASNEKLKPALEACINDAVQNAREKAEIIAESEDARVGEMISAEYGRTAGDAPPRPMLMKALAAESLSDGGLFSSDAEFSVTIRAAFRLK